MIKIEKVENNIDLITLKNDELEVVVSNYGCTLVKVLMKDQVGNVDDVVLGYDDFKSYQTLDAYIGALVGRVANRIKKGTFELNGQTYHLPINNGPNSLHGGIKGFSYQVFDYQVLDETSVEFHYVSKDGEEGYPGELDFKAIYSLEGDTLTMHYHATTSKDTLINITNHSYFNLSGKKENVYQHLLKVHADRFACIDPDGLPTGEIKDVKGTSFDFNEFAYIELVHEKTGRKLTVSTTLPQAQIYTANYLDGRLGKYGQHYNARDAICIETQNMPDAIHLEENPSTILKAGDTYDEKTSYKFEVIKNL